MGLAVAESTQQPAETFNSKPCTSTLKGISLLLTVTSLNEPEVAKLGPLEVLTTESLLSWKKENMNFNYCSELTVRVLIPLQWKELALRCLKPGGAARHWRNEAVASQSLAGTTRSQWHWAGAAAGPKQAMLPLSWDPWSSHAGKSSSVGLKKRVGWARVTEAVSPQGTVQTCPLRDFAETEFQGRQ